jgi:hypothetical protein
VVTYLNTLKTALKNTSDYLAAMEADIANNLEKIQEESNSNG